ncbi:MAG: hypothetical protein KDK63_02115 [Chlamydiia bacterium]|nr:hypothetical protein [Chlamydiia bacterium]
MTRTSDLIKKWADFSASETKPLFWMLFGPLLMMLTLIVAIPHYTSPYLPLLTAVGLVLSWRYRISGFSLTLMMFVLYFAACFLFGSHDHYFWKLGWGCSLALSLTISFLSMEELKSYYAKQKESKEKALKDLQISLHSFEEKTATEKRILEGEIDTLKEETTTAREEGEVLLSLVDASRIESDKIFKRNETLSKEIHEKEKALSSLEVDLENLQKKQEAQTENLISLRETAAKRLKELNTLRVAHYQAQLLAESYQAQVEKARAYFKAQKKEQSAAVPKQVQNLCGYDREDPRALLKSLEENKSAAKKAYDLSLQTYEALKKTASDPTTEEIKEKKKAVDHAKSHLVNIEREIFVTKKRLQETGILQ